MRKLIAILVFCVAGIASAESSSAGKPAAHEHRGFYSNMSFAFAYNWYKNSREDLSRSYFEYQGHDVDGKRRMVDYYEFDGKTFPMSELDFLPVHWTINMRYTKVRVAWVRNAQKPLTSPAI